MAIAILGWPVNLLPASVAGEVLAGARQVCTDAGMPLAGGHSIDAPEPIFGLAVTGSVMRQHLKRNDQARVGAQLFLTKPLGIGILTTAEKQKKLRPEDVGVARDLMCTLNKEVAEGSKVKARIHADRIPRIASVDYYLEQGCIPGGTLRNFDSYGHKIAPLPEGQQHLLCDPQTSGGLLVGVAPEAVTEFLLLAQEEGLALEAIGECIESDGGPWVEVI